MAKKGFILFLFILYFFKAESQNFGALPYIGNPNFEPSIESILYDSIHDKLIISSKYVNYAGNKKVRGVFSWNGSMWDSLRGGINTHDLINNQPNGTIQCGIPYNGKLLVGGGFESIGGVNATSLATWNGNVWDSLPIRAFKFLDYGASVYGLFKYNNKLYIYGSFDTIQGQKANGLATFDGISFQPVIIPFINADPTIICMSSYNNELYIGGNFYTTNSSFFKDIYKFNGTSWVDVGGSIKGSSSSIASMAIYNNELYAGGYFTKSSGNAGNIIMKWDGSIWKDAGWGNEYQNGGIWKLLVHHNILYAFGTFNLAGNKKASKVAAFDGTKWCTFADSLSYDIFTADVYRDTIYVGGAFHNINGDTTMKLVVKLINPTSFNQCTNVGINEISISDNINIYPNPAASILNITDQQNELQNSTIEITNSIGQTVITVPFNNSMDVSMLPVGCYFINITTRDKRVLHSKFIKE